MELWQLTGASRCSGLMEASMILVENKTAVFAVS